jgi:hypothetical protein
MRKPTEIPLEQLELPWTRSQARVGTLVVPAYQRRVQYSLVKSIVANYDPRRLQPLTINYRTDNLPYLIDGQQRREALLQLGHEHRLIWCIAYAGLSEAEEAFIYTATQETGARRILKPADQLKGAYYANDPDAISLTEVIRNAGLEVDEHQPSRATNLQAIASARRIMRRGGPDHLADVLNLVQLAYPTNPELGVVRDPNRGRLGGQLLLGLSAFLLHYPTAERDRLITQLRDAGLNVLRQRTGDYRKVVHSGRWDVATARAILATYNDRRGRGQLPAWEVAG